MLSELQHGARHLARYDINRDCGEGLNTLPGLARRTGEPPVSTRHISKGLNMAVTRAKKIEQVEKLSSDLKNASSMIVATYSKLTVTQDFELRKALRPTGAKYRVVKNTLAERAGKGTKVEEALKNLTGVTSIAYTEGDPVALAKALAKYAKDNPEFSFKAGLVEGRVITVKEIESLATMPSKDELYSKLLFLLNAPSQRLVTAMNAVGRNLAVVVSQGVEQKKFKEA
jgi:large subunit ribosomal protein L10